MDKGSTAAEAVEAAQRLREAGIRHSVMVMLGLGGRDRSGRTRRGHGRPAHGHGSALRGRPDHHPGARARPCTGSRSGATSSCRTPGACWRSCAFWWRQPFTRCRFHSNHASNYLPLSLNLPADRDRALAGINQVLDRRDDGDLKPEFLRGL